MATTSNSYSDANGEYFDSVLTYLGALCRNLSEVDAASVKPAIQALCLLRRKGAPAVASGVVYLDC